MGLEGAACDSGSDPAAGGSPAGARSCRPAAHTPAAHTARRHHRHRSCGRAGSWTWRALTSSSSNPRSSSTYQIGFQQLAGGLHHHLGNALGGQPVRQGLQAGGERRVGADLQGGDARDPDRHQQHQGRGCRPPPHPCRHPAPRPVPRPAPPLPPPTGSPVLVAPGRANRGNDAETRARSKQFVVPGRPPHQSRTRARMHQ
jgi:hypothetical protein